MEKLHKLKYCPEFAHDLLDLIHGGLLVPDKKLRWDSHQVVDQLGTICRQCKENAAYCLEPSEWKDNAVETLTVMVAISNSPCQLASSFSSQTAGLTHSRTQPRTSDPFTP